MKEMLEKMDKKKLMLVGGSLILIIVVLFGGAFLYNKFFYTRSYEEVENILVNASKDYFSKFPNELPTQLNENVIMTESDLVSAEVMKEISEYLHDENVSCDGSVTVTNINGEYRYVPNLVCGEKHKTKTFVDYIENNVPILADGNMVGGLYRVNNELVYRGENLNNYLNFSGSLYQIVKISDGYPVIIYADEEKLERVIWDNRYNVDKESSTGINNYSISIMREYLEELYDGETIVSEEDKLMIASHSLLVGKRSEEDTDKTGALERASVIDNQFIGLLPLYDFLNASLDSNCTSSSSPSCMNYNYLAQTDYSWWTMTADSVKTHRAFRISGSSYLSTVSNDSYIRPVFYLAKDALYVKGDGSYENPYVLK